MPAHARRLQVLEGNVLITGGSGFLGRAILRMAEQQNWPTQFTVYSRDETKQWELKHRYPETRCILGDVSRDLDRLIAAMNGHDIVIHCAAVKYIPEAEFNVSETIDVNIVGSRNVAIAARAADIQTVVGVSTDKACAPLNTYGATKMIMERYFAEANRMGKTKFVNVRYGNVVGSTGSVIPMFRRQISSEGRINLTDRRMTRFWMSVNEAVLLICYAANHGQAGWTIIDRCPAMRIVDLAEAVWDMERPGENVEINITGIRPGEKLHEALFNEQEAPRVQMTDRYFAMAPATHAALNEGREAYTSDNPHQWLKQQQIIELIKDAESV